MKNHLCIPYPPITLPDDSKVPRNGRTRFLLIHDPHHKDGVPGIGRLLDGKRQPIDPEAFRQLRDLLGATVESDEPELMLHALGLKPGEPGVVLAFRR